MVGRVHVVGYLSIDRIEAGGGIAEDVPGGGALYAALAARAAGAAVTLHAVAGADFDPAWLARLAALGIDLAAVAHRAGPTRRARLAYDADDLRRSAHHDETSWWERTAALAPAPPPSCAAGDIIALMPVPGGVADAVLETSRHSRARVAMDSSAAFVARERAAMIARAASVEVFAPSLEETRILLPGMDDDAAALHLAATGCNVLHKRGARGALAVPAHATRGVAIAAPTATLRDPTGAGDATLGGLAAALAAGSDFVTAARAAVEWGARCVSGIGPAALGLDRVPKASP